MRDGGLGRHGDCLTKFTWLVNGHTFGGEDRNPLKRGAAMSSLKVECE